MSNAWDAPFPCARPRNGLTPWVIVAAGVHERGGMDRANAALTRYLADRGATVHVVAHSVDASLADHPNVAVSIAPTPLSSMFLGEWPLDRLGRAVARRVTAQHPATRVVANGSNCDWGDINWVHYVHRASARFDQGAPLWYQAKGFVTKAVAQRREARTLPRARLLLANSQRTRDDLVRYFAVPASRVETVYLGADPAWTPPSVAERVGARAWLGRGNDRPIALFVGALGYDKRKGLDTLLSAWQSLCSDEAWDADLLVAGAGRGIQDVRNQVLAAGLGDRVFIIGFTEKIREVLAAADVLISPVRYESYGLNVQEAICRGIPAVVTRSAGIAERLTDELGALLLNDPDDVVELCGKLRHWRREMENWKLRIVPLAERVRSHTWERMAAEIVTAAESTTTIGLGRPALVERDVEPRPTQRRAGHAG